MGQTNLYSIYGARPSKDGKRVNITLVNGEGNNRNFATVSIKLESEAKVKAELKKTKAVITIPLLKEHEEKSEEVSNDDIPF